MKRSLRKRKGKVEETRSLFYSSSLFDYKNLIQALFTVLRMKSPTKHDERREPEKRDKQRIKVRLHSSVCWWSLLLQQHRKSSLALFADRQTLILKGLGFLFLTLSCFMLKGVLSCVTSWSFPPSLVSPVPRCVFSLCVPPQDVKLRRAKGNFTLLWIRWRWTTCCEALEMFVEGTDRFISLH